MSFIYRGLFILYALILLLGCSAPEITPGEPVIPPVIPEESEFTYSTGISLPPIQISGGNFHWHKKLPNTTYILEDAALEIYNFGDFDIPVAQLEIRVDGDSKLFDIGMTIPGGTKENVVVQPMMEGYDGGTHIVYAALLDENGGILYQNNGEEIGPLAPPPGTGSWEPIQN